MYKLTKHGVAAIKAILNGGAVRINGILYKFDFKATRISSYIDEDQLWSISDHTFETFIDLIDSAGKWAIIK